MMKDSVTYEVWWETAGKKHRASAMVGFETLAPVVDWVNKANYEEKENAEIEARPIRTRYFAVKATTNYEEVMTLGDDRPHSRACGVNPHPHGPQCHPNCPTCHSTVL